MFETVKAKKQRRQRGKRLNLIGKEDNGAQIFPPHQVLAAKEYAAKKQAEIDTKKAETTAKKVMAAENRQRKEEEAQERAIQRQVEKEVKVQTKAEKKAAKEA